MAVSAQKGMAPAAGEWHDDQAVHVPVLKHGIDIPEPPDDDREAAIESLRGSLSRPLTLRGY
jgi:hypothetical protein